MTTSTAPRTLASFVAGRWTPGLNPEPVLDAAHGRPVALISTDGLDFEGAVRFARRSGAALRRLTFHERAARLRALALFLTERKEELYALSTLTGATRRDGLVDIDGGIGTLFSYSSLARRELPAERFIVEGEVERLSKRGTFVGQHVLTPREGVAVHINAYNFPVWGALEKFAPNFIAGMPAIVKPATPTAYVTEHLVRLIDESGLLPEGSLQLICGGPGDLLDHLREQDVVTFTGSAATARKLKVHPNLLLHSVPFNTEADSLNCSVLGETVAPDAPEFDLFVREVAREMTSKAGQKCTAIRRVIVPRARVQEVAEALKARLARLRIGDPARDDVDMGPLVGAMQRDGVASVVAALRAETEQLLGEERPALAGGDWDAGGFLAPTVLYSDRPLEASAPHEMEPFGPVVTLMPYEGPEEAARLARMGRGSLVASVATFDRAEARELFFGLANAHGRVLVLNRDSAPESTGHGSPLPQLVHGGPGRAGGGEELGGLRAVKHYMQRTAVQADPATLTALTGELAPGTPPIEDRIHPFRKNFEELQVGDSLLTHRRTVTEADIVNFANVTGDYFYAHVDEVAAPDSIFGKRVAHGYFLISAAAGLFVSPAPGPVLANYGLERLRFVEPVGIGDTIRARLTVKRKTTKDPKPGERPTGVVEWAVEITNQREELVATYSILTLVERAGGAVSGA